jgi:hypothetical protein
MRRTFGNRDQFNTTATVFRVRIVTFPFRSGGESSPIRTRCQTLCSYVIMWDVGRYSRAEPWLDGKRYRDIANLKQIRESDRKTDKMEHRAVLSSKHEVPLDTRSLLTIAKNKKY